MTDQLINNNDFAPSTFMIETVLGCNLQCPDCALGGGLINRSKGIMSFDAYKLIADKIRPFARTVFLMLWGEPLINKDIFRMIRYTSVFANVTISTNGMMIDRDNARELISSGVKHVILSIDGATQDTYEQYRRGGNFYRVIESLSLLNEENNLQGRPVNIVPQFIVFRHNQHQLQLFADICGSIGVSPLYKAPYLRNGSRFQYSDIPAYIRHHFSDDYSRRVAMTNCMAPRKDMVFFLDGTVVPCCYANNADVSFGNIFEQDVLEIWNSPKYHAFRHNHYNGHISNFCMDNCLLYCSDHLPKKSEAKGALGAWASNDSYELRAIRTCLKLFNKPINALEWGNGRYAMLLSDLLDDGSAWNVIIHDQMVYDRIISTVEKCPSGVSITHISPERPYDGLTDGDFIGFRKYVLAPTALNRSFDLILVAGRARIECMAVAWELLSDNGVMVLPDAQNQEYASGVPHVSFMLKLTNQHTWVENPVAIMFLCKNEEVANSLARLFMDSQVSVQP